MPTALMKDICRLCAKQGNVCVDVFGEDGLKQNIERKVRLCTPIIIKEEEDMPKQICLGCLDQLDRSYDMYLTCVNAQTVIKKLLGKRQTRSTAALGSTTNTNKSNCGVSNSLLSKLNSGEVSLNEFLADDDEPSPSKRSRQENSTSLEAPPPEICPVDGDVKPVPGIDVPDVDTLLKNAAASGSQHDVMGADTPFSVSQGGMMVINSTPLMTSGGVGVPPVASAAAPALATHVQPSVSCALSVSPSSTAETLSYVMNGIGASPVLESNPSLLSNSTVLVEGAQGNMYVSDLSGVVTNQTVCAVAPMAKEADIGVMVAPATAQRVPHFEVSNDPPTELTYTTLMPRSSGATASTQSNIYVEEVNSQNLAFTGEQFYIVNPQASTQVTPANPVVSSPQSLPTTKVYGRNVKTDQPRVVYSNRAPMTASLSTSSRQFIPAVSLAPQAQQTQQQVNEPGVISHSSQTVQTNSKQLVAVACPSDPASSPGAKIIRISSPISRSRVQVQDNLPTSRQHMTLQVQPQQQTQPQQQQTQPLQQTQQQQQQQQHVQAPVQQGIQMPLLKLGPPTAAPQLKQSSVLEQHLKSYAPLRSYPSASKSTGPATPTTAASGGQTKNTSTVYPCTQQSALSSSKKSKGIEAEELCEHCHKPFPPDILIHHRVLHFRERFFSCISCGKNFRTELGLDQHRCEAD